MAFDHLNRAFDEEMDQLNALVAQLGGLAESMIRDSVEALRRGDHDLATEVIVRDKQLDAIEAEIEKLAIQTIALRQPVAGDLRQIVAAFKISGMLERVGDHAKNIARSTLKISNGRLAHAAKVPPMADIALGMIHSALDAFAARDSGLAADVVERDEAVDALYKDLVRALIEHLSQPEPQVVAATELMLVARFIERIGDNATNIAEAVYYAVVGQNLPDRHKTPG